MIELYYILVDILNILGLFWDGERRPCTNFAFYKTCAGRSLESIRDIARKKIQYLPALILE